MINVLGMLLLQEDASSRAASGIAAVFGGAFLFVTLAVLLVVIAGLWKIFTKAGEPGWAAIVPIYAIVLLKLAGKPAWWIVLLIIPGVNMIVGIIVAIALAQNFGKGTGYGLGLAFLPPIFYPMLGFGDARYQPVATA